MKKNGRGVGELPPAIRLRGREAEIEMLHERLDAVRGCGRHRRRHRPGRYGNRSGPADTMLSRLEAAGALTITLGPLSDAAAIELATDLLGGTPDDGLLQVLERIQGHPFLLTELLRGLREERLVEVVGGLV